MRAGHISVATQPLRSFRKKPLQVALFGVSLMVQTGLMAPIFGTGSNAMAASQQQAFSIAPGPLGSVLSRFASDAGVVLSFDSGLTAGKQSVGLQGTYSVEQGFARLLADSNLALAANNDGSYGLAPQGTGGALTLGATSINAEGLGLTTENSGSYTTGATSTATKLPLTLRETPQSVSVVTRQLMDDQHLSTLNEVLSFTPGITSNHRDSERYSFYSRGFDIQNFQYDGIPSQVANESQQFIGPLSDMAIYDRVEVVRGATGLMSGAGTPSATINLVRKRPTKDFQAHISGEAGAWDRYRSEVDVSGPLTETGNVRGRFVAVYQKQNAFVDWYKQDKRVMYGALDIDLNDNTTLRTSLDYQNNDANGSSYGHIPLFYSNGSQTHFSRSFNPATRSSYMDNTSYTFTTMLDHKLDNDWGLKTAYSHQYSYRKGQGASASGSYPDPITGQGAKAFIYRLDSYQTQDTLDVYASGPFQLGAREHELVVGASTSRTHLNFPDYSSTLVDQDNDYGDVNNIFAWDGRQYGRRSYNEVGGTVTTLQQTGIYGALRLKPMDPLTLILGTRVSWWKQLDEVTEDAPYSKNTDKTKKSGVVTPYAGIIYDLNDTYSVYASYTSIFLPQTFYKTASGGSLAPLEGDNYEIGLKGEFFQGALNASIALFDIEQKNTAADSGNDATGKTVYKAIAGTTTRGVETEISGEVAAGWNVFGGYTYRESHSKDGERVQVNQPINLFKLGTSYRLPGALNRLTVGGNVTWQSEMYATTQINYTGPNYKAVQDPYAVVGLLANYKVDEHLSVGLNVNNLFDKKYYDGMGTFNSGSYGDPRNAMVNAKWKF
ncbi:MULTISPECIES: TonB-dependent siderophore receptor [unclassified Pseudomonas]|uniref:TonB-dependent siderophore receptor n=1 Tax=unclassified Pseudomonas TaxID=196821 RepID=UPI000812B013|nr:MULTISPECIES: TonB-dependent receptor [unclassified Pseudomonas]CRM27228.1 Ferripyoverdine receptor precursor [Pseudomonas sp. 24 R 17]CRM61427.1 Ferripyoverdine receptor precursor [Pseudomonas sp. 58 R 12]